MNRRFASLGSGSKGNSTLVQFDSVNILIDCGFTAKEAVWRLSQIGLAPESLSAILVTHEHGDHGKGVFALARKFSLPVYLSAGTLLEMAKRGNMQGVDVRVISARRFQIAGVEVTPVAVPHDSREALQFTLNDGHAYFGIITDLGHVTPHIIQHYRKMNSLILECNHDLQMLQDGPYPPSLKKRVAGQWGHLNNQQSALFLEQILHQELRHVVISHISEHNNDANLAWDTMAAVEQGIENRLRINTQDAGLDWHSIL